ncbi:unannotated protein [freshwater metagenome]|uniref:Unannotated protein n=1 Tax=freshwater metagenome TaxID=449393 RepID=A0A6J6ZJW7_9ZZZZ
MLAGTRGRVARGAGGHPRGRNDPAGDGARTARQRDEGVALQRQPGGAPAWHLAGHPALPRQEVQPAAGLSQRGANHAYAHCSPRQGRCRRAAGRVRQGLNRRPARLAGCSRTGRPSRAGCRSPWGISPRWVWGISPTFISFPFARALRCASVGCVRARPAGLRGNFPFRS